jgi:pimeloyl-ACP methyl ester carboxylesterase
MPPILMIHGAFANHLTWYSQIKLLCNKTELILFDLPGHGKSSKQLREYQLEFFAYLLKHLIEELRLENPIVMGHSLGGFIAQLGAIYCPTLISKLILLCTGPFFDLNGQKVKIPTQILVVLEKVLSKFRWSLFCKILDKLSRKHTIRGLEGIKLEEGMAASCSGRAFMKVILPFIQLDLTSDMKATKMPILVITGTKDIFYSHVPFYQSLSNARVKIVDGGEHVLHLLNDEPNRWILEFICEKQ